MTYYDEPLFTMTTHGQPHCNSSFEETTAIQPGADDASKSTELHAALGCTLPHGVPVTCIVSNKTTCVGWPLATVDDQSNTKC